MSKRFSVLALAVFVTLAGPAAIAQSAPKSDAAKAPRLTVVDPVKDFGIIPKGETLEWNFQVKNTGNSDLEIIAARPACGCTVSDFDKVIKPGQTGKLHAVVHTDAFVGPIAKTVTIETNDPSTPTATVTLSAIVKPYVEAHPAGFVRFNMIEGESESQGITLYSEETEPFEILKVESPRDYIKVDFAKLDASKNIANVGRAGQAQYRVLVTVGGDTAKVGPIAEKVKITTNSKHQPEYLLSVSGVIRPSFRLEPSSVNFGEVSPTETAATRLVTVRSNNLKAPESFVVSKVESNVKGLTAEVKPTANKGEYEVTLKVAGDAKGDLAGDVKIFSNDKVRPEVTIPVKGSVKAAAK